MSIWRRDIVSNLRILSGVEGRTPGEPPIASMGSTNPPLIEKPMFILDHIVSDGAQVTRPSIDPYREPIETEIYLFDGELSFSMPIIIGGLIGIDSEQVDAIVLAGFRMGVGVHLEQPLHRLPHMDVRKRVFLETSWNGLRRLLNGPVVLRLESVEELDRMGGMLKSLGNGTQLVARVPCLSNHQFYREVVKSGFHAFIVDEDLGGDEPLEIAISEADHVLKKLTIDGLPARYSITLIAASNRVRSSSDVFKLGGLGADACIIREAWRVGVDYKPGLPAHILSERLENLLIGIQKEIKLLMGAAGVSAFQSSIVGNRELFRAIDLPYHICEKLGVKPAGE